MEGVKYRASRRLLILLVWFAVVPFSAAASDDAGLWAKLKTPGHFAIMRHALAPGTGDPADFDVADCRTQRNLSAAGRRQSERTGDAFRKNGIAEAAVYSSRWCRCLDTARLLNLGPVKALEPLNSFFADMSRGPAQIRTLRETVAAMDLARPVVMVTHQVVITGLADVFPASGEIVVMRRRNDGTTVVVGRISPRSTK